MSASNVRGSLKQSTESKDRKAKDDPAVSGNGPLSEERREIISWLKSVRFRHRIFGGVDEKNVWKKIAELDALYAKLLEAERVRYDVLIAEAAKRADARETEGSGASGNSSDPGTGSETGGDSLG